MEMGKARAAKSRSLKENMDLAIRYFFIRTNASARKEIP